MIKIENTEVHGWEAAIRGMRNPMNSWERIDSYWGLAEDESPINPNDEPFFFVGPNDLDLAKRLAHGGPVHGKYLRMITVTADIVAPLYWWSEYDTYKVGTVANSCSKMHKIHAKPFERDDFSVEHLIGPWDEDVKWGDIIPHEVLLCVIETLNKYREMFIETKDKRYWWQMIQLLPNSYNQRRTVQLNYEVLRGQYKWRKDHKLDEWHAYCDWALTLPYFKDLCVEGAEDA